MKVAADFVGKEKYSVEDLVDILKVLRSPEGCPWDREQDHKSIRRDFLEECYEAIEAIESVCKSRKKITTPSTGTTGVSAGGYVPFPVEVTVGGATLFVLNVDQFLKL